MGGASNTGSVTGSTATTTVATSNASSAATMSTGTNAGSTGSSMACTTRVTYGDAWIHPPSHPDDFDDAPDTVTWDGVCTNDGANSYASLSNGWKPYFTGHGGCVLALDSSCAGTSCTTRITYGPTWAAPPNHPTSYDDVVGRVMWNRGCIDQTGGSYANLTNGWQPHFNGADACDLSFKYDGCGGLYENPVVDVDCPDPGVLLSNGKYVVGCTSGNATDAFPLRTSTDLVHWSDAGHIFPSASKPSWAVSDFWAPEVHAIGSGFVAYFTARHMDGRLSIGAATAPSPTGPFTDLGHPLVQNATLGVIDPTEFDDAAGNHYLVWKVDGNAAAQPTPIFAQKLAADGKSLIGAATELITNDEAWEGPCVEGPWVVANGGYYYLFYSGSVYNQGSYAVGVARAQNPLGPYQKLGSPILSQDGAWAGPGHCSVVTAPSGDTVIVYHAWVGGQIGGGPGRVMLVDQVEWSGGWPHVLEAPSDHSRPMP